MHTDILVTLTAYQQNDLQKIKEQWLTLERMSDTSFFLTWAWIGPWLSQCCLKNQTFSLLCAKQDGVIVGLSILIKKKRKVFGFFTVEQWWLNRSGDELLDQCWIEENDFLIAQSNHSNIQKALLNFIKEACSWQEFVLGMSDNEAINHFSLLSPHSEILFDDKGYMLDYTDITSEDDYIKSVLSRNTRQKIRQSEKLLSKQGELTVNVLTADEKTAHVSTIANFHIKRWENTLTPSGFIHDDFSQIFNKVIQNNNVEVMSLTQKESVLGYLVFFVYKNKVYFYLSALSANTNNKIKLGMLFHQKAIIHYLSLGISQYDFLAGDARYKKSLTNDSYSQQMVVFYRKNTLLFCEQTIRKLKKSIKQYILSST